MSEPSRPIPVKAGDILAEKYRVERVLGEGGMGLVVAAEHLDLHEKVAIKFLLDSVDLESEHAERFLREARAAVKIKSEHVARVIDVGRLPSRAPYMVMEYLEGSDLSEVLERGRVSIEDAVDYVIQACEAMSVAHAAGIVHRDLKPANLFLTHRPDGSEVIKVLDFGISKVTSPQSTPVNLTQTSATMGSPLYMSPEQVRSTKSVDHRTDIWALGAILYELLLGEPPFLGDTLGEVFARVMTEPPRTPRSLRAEIPEELEAVVLRCLQKAPELRFQTVEALAVALGPFASRHSTALVDRLSVTLQSAAHAATVPPVPFGESVARDFAERADQKTRIEASPAPTQVTKTSWSDSETRLSPGTPRRRGATVAAAAVGALLASGLGYVALMQQSPSPAGDGAAGAALPTLAPSAVHRAAEAPVLANDEPVDLRAAASAPSSAVIPAAPEVTPVPEVAPDPGVAPAPTVTPTPTVAPAPKATAASASGSASTSPGKKTTSAMVRPLVSPEPSKPATAPAPKPEAAAKPRRSPLSIEFK